MGYYDARPGSRAAVTSGPKAYTKTSSDTLQCPACMLFNSPDSQWCDQCGQFLTDVPRPRDDEDPRRLVHCTSCSARNMPDALHCLACGRKLPNSAYAAALAAKAAIGEANLTSSSGRQPTDADLQALSRRVAEKEIEVFGSVRRPGGAGMTPQERQEYIDGRALRQERQRALQLVPLTGDPLHDAAAAQDRAAEIQSLWEALADEARRQRSELGSWPDPAAVAACRQAEADAEAAWQARQAAVAQRDALQQQLTGRTPEQDDADAARFEAIWRAKRHEQDRKPDVDPAQNRQRHQRW